MSVEVYINGAQVLAQEGSSTHRLNKTWSATATQMIDTAPPGDIGGRMVVIVDGDYDNPEHHGIIKHISDDDGEDGGGKTTYTSYDARELWEWRPARDADGNYTIPTFLEDFVTGPQIMEEILHNSEDAGAGPPGDAEGPLLLEFGTFEGSGVDLSGMPADFPMMIEQVASMLCDTGELDIILTPLPIGDPNISRIDCYNGDYGDDLSATVSFLYGGPGSNLRRMRRTQDMSQLANKIRYLLGPKHNDHQWNRSIEATNMDLPDPPQTAIAALIAFSRLTYNVRSDIRILDSLASESDAVELYLRQWQNESILRAQFRTLVHGTPIRGLRPAFDVGDLIGMEAWSLFRGGFSGVQRCYERTISWNEDGVVELAEIVASPDGEAV